MRLSILFIVVCTLSACGSKMSRVTYIDQKNVSQKNLNFATQIAHSLLESMKSKTYYELTLDEATETMVTGLNESLQKKSYMQIAAIYGEFESMTFYNVARENKGGGDHLVIYRFKGKFGEKSNLEVRTILNNEGKLAGFFVLPWSDQL